MIRTIPIVSIISPLLALLIFDYLWGCDHGFQFFRLLVTYAFALFFGMVLAMPAFVWNARKAQAIVVTVLCVWLEAQLLYGRQFFNAIPPSAYAEAFTVAKGFGSAIIALLSWWDLLLLIPVLLAWGVTLLKPVPKAGTFQRLLYVAALIATWLVSWGHVMYAGGLEKCMRNCAYSLSAQKVSIYTPFSVLWNDLALKFRPLDKDSRQQITDWWKEHERLFGNDKFPVEKPPTKVVLVMVESLESWLVGLEVEGQTVMPTLTAMANDTASLYIPNVVCQVLGGHSSDAQLLDLGGMLPLVTGTWALEKHRNLKYSLPQAFTEAHPGASTAYFATDAARNWNQGGYAPYMGFQTNYFREDYPENIEARMTENRLDDIALAQFVGGFLNTDKAVGPDRQFLVQEVTISLHSMFQLPKGVNASLKLDGSYDDTMRGYLLCARYTDEGLKILLDSLASRPDFNDIAVIVTGDHVGIGYRRQEIRSRHGWVTEAPTVPLVVFHSPVQGKINKYIGQVDLYPTLLDILGLKDYKWRGMGVSALNPRHPGVGYNLMEGPFGNPAAPREVLTHLKGGFMVSHNTLYYDLMQ